MRNLVIVLAVAAALSACGSETIVSAEASVAGTYTAKTANGSNLPFTAATTPVKVEVVSGSTTLTAAGSFTSTTKTRFTSPAGSSDTDNNFAGSFKLNGSTITFSTNDGSTFSGTIAGGTLTVAQQGITLVSTKN